MKKTAKGFAAFILATALFVGMTPEVHASTYSQLQQAQKDKDQAQDGIENAKEDLDDLNTERASLQTYLDQLNGELSKASSQLADIEGLIEDKEADIVAIQEELAKAREDEQEQYEAMKDRIKFMYERGDSAYMELFFTSGSFGEFLNKAEYVEKLSAYDRKMLESYVALQEKIRKDEQSLVDEREALDELKQQAKDKQNEVAGAVSETSANMADYLDQISDKEQEMLEYEKQLDASENDITSLQAKLEEENRLTQQAALAGFADLSSITFAAGDIDLLAAIIECEAGGESYTGKVAVGNVVMNRVKSAVFPNTVLEVIYQNRQFSPVGSGRFAVVLARGANANCYQAAQEAMAGSAPVGNCLFFRTPIPGLTGIQIGGHIFY